VAEAAGFSKGAVYSNFASKEELFFALLQPHLEQELYALTQVVASGPSRPMSTERPEEEPPATFARLLEQSRTWTLLTLEFWLYAVRNEDARERLAARYQSARAGLAARAAERYRAEGRKPPMPVEYQAWAALALGTGLAIQAYLEPGALPDELYQTVMGLLLDGGTPSQGTR
jgi:AcrR family transcriptional regulator